MLAVCGVNCTEPCVAEAKVPTTFELALPAAPVRLTLALVLAVRVPLKASVKSLL